MTTRKQPIVIFGKGDPGGLALKALRALGVHLDPEKANFAAEPAPTNQRTMNATDTEFLNHFQMSQESTRSLPANWEEHPLSQVLVNELKQFIKHSGKVHCHWGIYRPDASLLGPIYARAFRELELDPQYVILVSEPPQILGSDSDATHQQSAANSLLIGGWLCTTLAALKMARHARHVIVTTNQFAADPERFLSQIVAQSPDWRPSKEEWSRAMSIAKTALPPASEQPQTAISSKFAEEVYEACLANPPDTAKLDALVHEFDQWQELLAPPRPGGTQAGLAWYAGNNVDRVQIPFLPNGGWQTLRFEFNAPPNTEVNGLLYNKPCRAWIRRIAFVHDGKDLTPPINPGPGSILIKTDQGFRLDGAYEARQLIFLTPRWPGPYTLEIELWLETGQPIVNAAIARLASRIHQCTARLTAGDPR